MPFKESGGLQKWEQQSHSPAAPAGQQQAAHAAQQYEDRAPGFRDSQLGRYTHDKGYVDQAQSWYSGANREGTNNGWDNSFTRKFIDGQNKAAAEGRLGTYFEQPDATGVVTWDHASSDGRHQFTFGDIYSDGKKVGNVYDDFKNKGDQHGSTAAADLMMADWLFTGKQKAEIFSRSDRDEALTQAVKDLRTQNNTDIPKMLKAQEFSKKVSDTSDRFEKGHVDEAIEVGGGVGGALLAGGAAAAYGAAAGVETGPGALLSGAAGFAVGFTGALLNKDELTDQAARAYEITAMSSRENGRAAGMLTGVKEWSGFSGRLISPLSNVTHGTADLMAGKVGDGQSDFYRVDKKGDRVVPKWLKVADVGATVGDSLTQFASPVGAALFTAQMSGTIGGEVGELVVTKGKTFDDRRGGFDNIFTDDKGNFDAKAGAAGIAKVGIDAVQMGMARGLMGKTNALRSQVGLGATYQPLSPIKAAAESISERMPWYLGGQTNRVAAREALANGGHELEYGGMKYIVDSQGKAVSRKATLGILAPSEQLSTISAGVLGRRAAAVRGGALKTDDFYQGARAMAAGENKWRTIITNAMGEGYEEGLQAILEPLSHNANISASDVFSSAAYGAAAGAGMGAGTAFHQPSQQDRLFATAQQNQIMRTGGTSMTRKEFDALPEHQQRMLAAQTQMETQVAQAAYQQVAQDQGMTNIATTAGYARLKDAVQGEISKNLARLTDRTDGAFVITPIEEAPRVDANGGLMPGSMPTHAIGASALQTAANLTQHHRGLAIQLDYLQSQLPKITDAEEQAKTQADIDKTRRVLEWGQRIDPIMDDGLQRIKDSQTEAEARANVEVLNDLLRKSFDMKLPDLMGQVLTDEDKLALARAVSLVNVRDPQDQAGSYQVLVPQISYALTRDNAHNVVQISYGILPALSGDFDGDKIRAQAQLILDDAAFASARSGAAFIGTGTSVNVAATKAEKWVVGYVGEAFASGSPAMQAYAEATVQQIATSIRGRYQGLGIDSVLDEVFAKFFDAMHTGSKDARAALLDGLADKAGGVLNEFARGQLSNEWLWIDQLVRSSLDTFQSVHAANRPSFATPDTTAAPKVRQSSEVRERKRAKAATLGQTLGLWTAGVSMFRKFQKLHYSVLNSSVLSADERREGSDLSEMALFYESAGQGITRAELEEVHAKDEITGRVFVQLRRLALDAKDKLDQSMNEFEALALIANLRVKDVITDERGEYQPGPEISLAQLLLKRSVEQDRREKDAIYDNSPELQAKHARLLGMTRPNSRNNPVNAERAFVETVGAQQFFTLLGDDSSIFGPHLTVEQFLRQYTGMSELERRDMDLQLRTDGAYLGTEGKHDMPYDLTDKISAYRSVVDAVIAVGHNRITIDKEGNLHGEIADRSDRASNDFQAGHKAARQAMQELLALSPRREGELTEAVVARLLESNPDFAKQVMELIPKTAANAVLTQRADGTVVAAHWVYKMFTLSDPVEAEMHYWRNLLIAEWNALGANNRINEDGEFDEKAREYDSLPRRMHRIIYKLAKEPDNGQLQIRFLHEMESATSLKEFLRWVNTTPGIRGEQAPITAWVDDVAEFDADKAGGGWTTSLQGSELREAMSTLRTGAARLTKDLTDERVAWNADLQVLQAIRRVVRANGGADVALDAGDRELYDRFEKSIDLAGEQMLSLGPNALIYQVVGAARGFYPQAHTKGLNPDNVEPQGAFDALRDSFDYVTNYERMMASLTAVNLSAVSGNLGQVAKDGVRTMDDFGRQVVQSKPTVEQMLDLLEAQDTRPLARAILFPQVMERTQDGRLSPQMLVGKSLKGLLDGSTMKGLFAKDGFLATEPALKYAVMVEAEARKFGGHLAFHRAVNDLVIARTSMADHVLSGQELEKMAVDAVVDIAKALQDAGSIAATPSSPGVDPLAELMPRVRQAQRVSRLGGQLGLATEDFDKIDITLDSFKTARASEHVEEISRLTDALAAAKTPDEQRLLQQAIDDSQADHEAFDNKLELLRSDDMAKAVVEMFAIPADPTAAVDKKQAILRYIDTHFDVLEKATPIQLTLYKLTQQLLDPSRNGQPDLSDSEWTELSNAVIALYLDETMSVGLGFAVTPFPDSEHAEDQRYYDTTFAYLADPILDSSSPLVQAAKNLHLRAGRRDSATTSEIIDTLDRTIFKEYSLGRWSTDVVRSSIEAGQRLLSAAAAPAIAMAGNSPKRQGVISAATRRTFLDPTDEMLSSIDIRAKDLGGDLFDEVDVTHPSGLPASMPLAQLNNRFASSVIVTTPNGDQVDLLATDRLLGRSFLADPRGAASRLKEIHVERIQDAIENHANARGYKPEDARVAVTFAHPDMQPAAAEWYNNLFFEGTSFKLDADSFESLNAGLWFSYDGINQSNQRAALDASKLGKPAIQVIDTASAAERENSEQDFTTNLAGVLRNKTRLVLEKDLGNGKLDPEMYNALLKNLKLRHFVRGQDENGEPTLWTAEQVIAHQTNNTEPLPIQNPELWMPTDDVLRSMLGEQGTQGVARLLPGQLEIDLSRIPAYTGVTPEMVANFDAGMKGESIELADTTVANRARQLQLSVRGMLTDTERHAFDARMRFFRERTDDIYSQRAEANFDIRSNLARALEHADAMLHAENIAFDWTKVGLPFIGPRNPIDTAASGLLLHELAAAIKAESFRTGWIYREGDTADAPAGKLSEVSIGAPRGGGMRVAPGDLVVVELDSFRDNEKVAEKRLTWLADNGATIALGNLSGANNLRVDLSLHLEKLGYERVAGSGHVFRPAEVNSRNQNMKARESTLTEMRGISGHSRVAVFNVMDQQIEENGAWVNSGNERLSSIAVSLDLVPTDFLAGFNVPVEGLGTENQIEKVRNHLRGLNSSEGLSLLRAQAGVQAGDTSFDEAFQRMIDRFDANPGTVLPSPGEEFGTGDLIPLTDQRGRILLYRHGYKAPRRTQVDKMLAQTVLGKQDAANVAVFRAEPESLATTHKGTVVRFQPRAGYGLSVELDIPLQVFGAKKQLEWNGMKYLLTPKPDSVKLPDHPFFDNGWGIDMIASAHDAASKESHADLVNNHRNAFAFFGIDFLPDVTEFFYPGEGNSPERQRAVREILHQVSIGADRIDVAAADEILNANRIAAALSDKLLQWGQTAQIDTGFVDKLNDETVEAQIARGVITYLMTRGARVNDVLSSGGFNNDDSNSPNQQSQLMPRLFTQIFDKARPGSDLRVEINRRLNSQFDNPSSDQGYVLHQDFTFETISRGGGISAQDAAAQAGFPLKPGIHNNVDPELLREYRDHENAGQYYRDMLAGGARPTETIKVYVHHPGSGMPPRIADGNNRLNAALEAGTPVRIEVIDQDHDHSPNGSVTDIWSRVGAADGTRLQGFLQFAEAHDSGDNPIKNGMAFDETEKASVSPHSASIAYQSVGGITAHKYDLTAAQQFTDDKFLERDFADGGVWRLLNAVPENDASFQSWRAQTPAESARRGLAREAVVQFRQPIDTGDNTRWSDAQRKQYREYATQIVRQLKLKDSQVGIVDGWVRQVLGQPHGTDEHGEELGRVVGKAAVEAAKDILANVSERYMPTFGAEVPMLHVHDLQLIFRANQGQTNGWRPRESADISATPAKSWDEWVNVSLGQALVSNELFDPLYLLATDGFMHSYQSATRSLMDLPVSVDALVSRTLLDESTQRMLVSIDQMTNDVTFDPILLDVQRATLDELLGGRRIAGKFKGKAAPASEVARRREIRRQWRRENGVPAPIDVTMRNFRKNGAQFVDASTTTNAVARSMINLRVGTALINPALWVSMGPEQWIRGSLDRMANLLTGQATTGMTGMAMAKERSVLGHQFSLSVFTPEQITDLRGVYDILGQRQDFKAMVYKDLMYQRPYELGMHKVEKWLEGYAKFGSRMQDPTWGMKGNTMARRYMEAAIQHIQATPTLNVLTVDQLINEMRTDPTFLKTNFPEAHNAASNAIAQIRSLKPTPLSLALRGIYEPMSESSHAGVNFFGNVVLKLPLLFSGYAMNVLTTITGMQGFSDIFAAWVDGSPKSTLIGRAQAAMRGEQFKPEEDATFDMSSVSEGIDLSRSFIRGGLTHTGLFALGLAAGGLGLDGEDDEAKRRRRAAELQGAGMIYDPRRIENDFRNADALYLGWMPAHLGYFFGGPDQMGQPHWMLRQFISPIIGMERFFETGDFQNVTWGFQDALGAFPLINTMMWSDAVETAGSLADMADAAAAGGRPADLISAHNLLTTAVGTYERMLFENAFVNAIYQGADKYDRDPYVQPQYNADGTLRTDAMGNTEGSAVLQPYRDPETGEVKEGYTGRDQASASLHAMTENRATMAGVMSLFTGLGHSDYLRRNMPIKTRTIEKPPVDQATAEAYLRAALQGGGGLQQLNADELSNVWKTQAKANGQYVDWDVLDKQAAGMIKGLRPEQNLEPLSMLDAAGREKITQTGGEAILRGLLKGSVKLGDPSLSGLHIPFEMREKIQDSMMKELVQEGLDMGLNNYTAQARMKRLWYGPTSDSTVVGVGDLLWSKNISYTDKVEYNQLNTTYITGPDGRPWATGYQRGGAMGALGLKPINPQIELEGSATRTDGRGNTVDLVNNMNTGLRALELKPDAHIPTDKEIADSIIKAIEKAGKSDYTPAAKTSTGSGGGYGFRRYGGYGGGYGGYGGYGGGGYSSSGYTDFEKMYALPNSKAPFGDSIPFINTSNPILRRESVRRERVWSERGKLKQWQ